MRIVRHQVLELEGRGCSLASLPNEPRLDSMHAQAYFDWVH